MIFDDYDTPSKELFSGLKWLPVDNRIVHSKAVLVYKSLHNLVPMYMRDLFTYQSNQGVFKLLGQTASTPYDQRHKEI